jgi:hypothetical protein
MEAMTGKDKKEHAALDRLADAFVDDILQASDEEILAEFVESHGDPAKNATDLRALFEKTVLATNKRRLKAAQARIAASRTLAKVTPVPAINIAEARQRLRRILASGTADVKLTLAARKEDELSDSDVLGMLEDLQELGAIPPDDDKGGHR